MLDKLRQEGLGVLDEELAELLVRLCPARGETAVGLGLGAALASAWRRNQHTCLPLSDVAGCALGRAAGPLWGETAPDLAAWRRGLLTSGLVSRGLPDEAPLPLVLDGADRLYLERMHRCEDRVAQGFILRLDLLPAPPGLEALLEELAPADRADPEQRQALRAAFLRRVSVLTGGPGTGKTSTLGLLLALAARLEPDLVIRLAAPTGKAAARMQEAIAALSPESLPALPPAQTLHRLLLERPDLDWLVVDEASMVDLPLMARALELLPPAGRLLLIGDAGQLSSVEAGAVLAELCEGLEAIAAGQPDEPPALTRLWRSRRFSLGGGIGGLAEAVRTGDASRALELLGAAEGGLAWIRPGEPGWNGRLTEILEAGYRPFLEADDDGLALRALETFRPLCAQRRGRLGVEGINAWCERRWRPAGSPGRAPLLVRANDRVLGLANGDSGVLSADLSHGSPRCLLSPAGTPLTLAVAQLPAHDLAWAITVHQSQGSEMDEVLLILPEAPSPLLTRELLYTGLTRARRRVTLLATEAALRQAIVTRAERSSGLADRLRSHVISEVPPGRGLDVADGMGDTKEERLEEE